MGSCPCPSFGKVERSKHHQGQGDENHFKFAHVAGYVRIAFPRNRTDDGWATLEGVDYVVASSVDDRDNPQSVLVHMIDADEMRERFGRAYAARRRAGHSMPPGRGIWISLYEKEANQPVSLVGAGAGIAHPPIAKVPLGGEYLTETGAQAEVGPQDTRPNEPHLSISEAKRRLALSLGVNETDIKITISS